MPIPERFIDELVARLDIVSLVSRYVQLKKSGGYYVGLCPFHNEKTPSFTVTPDRQIYHCFGCGAGGGVIGFIMKIERLDFVEAVRFLAPLAGLEVPEEDAAVQSLRRRRERLYELNKAAARYFHDTLQTPEGKEAADYFTRRGLTPKTVTSFGLGWAPPGWDNLIRAMTAKGFQKEDLKEVGLALVNKEGRLYDRFRARVMFPIIDVRGNVVAFGGRVLDDSVPKYLNSPESNAFHKGGNLFALNLARKSDSRQYILAEGYMDVIALHQAGFGTAVASLGTALTEEQTRLIGRYADEVVIAYDSDEAGRKATNRAIEILKKSDLKVRVLDYKGAKDPDEYIRKKGRESFALLINQSETHIEYKLQRAAEGKDLKNDQDRVAFLKEAVAVLAAMDNAVEREIFTGRAAETAGVSAAAVENEIKKAVAARKRRQKAAEHRALVSPTKTAQPAATALRYENVRSALAEEQVLLLGFYDEEILREAGRKLRAEDFSSPFLAGLFREMLALAEQERPMTMDALAAGKSPEESDQLARILSAPVPTDRRRALRDCADLIQMEAMKKKEEPSDDLLTKAAERYRMKKGFGGMGK